MVSIISDGGGTRVIRTDVENLIPIFLIFM